MIWRYPLSASQITGRQTLTEAAPITRIHNAVNELQGKVVAAADVGIQGLAISSVEIQNNTLIIRGRIVGGDLEQRVNALENALYGAKLKVDITRESAGVAATGTLTWGGNFGQAESVPGDLLGVQGCGEEEEDA